MRLLDTTTLKLEVFLQRKLPAYAILSHTWEDEEVTLQELQSGRAAEKNGFEKIAWCCRKAAEDGYDYCWVDTCCIDKTSSAELSEAINSMYRWYRDSSICYAYLSDVKRSSWETFRRAKWFTRGWTLQELIAPRLMEFYDGSGLECGTKFSLRAQIAEITGIAPEVLQEEDHHRYTVATRMSWAAKRKTTRLEDEAYCLLGIFGINMPLLYGEGERAFRRLQEEIMRVQEDYTLLVWRYRNPDSSSHSKQSSGGLLARSPMDFAPLCISDDDGRPVTYAHLSRWSISCDGLQSQGVPPSLTSRGLHVSLPLKDSYPVSWEKFACLCEVRLDGPDSRPTHLMCVRLFCRQTAQEVRYYRDAQEDLHLVPWRIEGELTLESFALETIYIEQPPPSRVQAQDMTISSPWSIIVTKLPRNSQSGPLLLTTTPLVNVQQLLEAPKQTPLVSVRQLVESPEQIARSTEKVGHKNLSDNLLSISTAARQKMMLGNPDACLVYDTGIAIDHLRCWIRESVETEFTVTVHLEDHKPYFDINIFPRSWWQGHLRVASGQMQDASMGHCWPDLDRFTLWMTHHELGSDTAAGARTRRHRCTISLRRIASQWAHDRNIHRVVLSIEAEAVDGDAPQVLHENCADLHYHGFSPARNDHLLDFNQDNIVD
ncbi:heterokaryon incompatibility protein-domain-containing protein [Paraphoma chrysanthemicola]|nr:heterokaryon incompatibility protein-domain-containing protein [Paraphoma chrysanthemicola]